MRQLFYCLLVPLAGASFVFLDWTFDIPAASTHVKYLLEYTPGEGAPPSNTVIDGSVTQLTINHTRPATEYRVALTAFDADNNQQMLIEKHLISSSFDNNH